MPDFAESRKLCDFSLRIARIFNYARWYTPEWDEIQNNITSVQAWDADYLAHWMSEWEQAFYRDAVGLPVSYQIAFLAINNRVAHYNWERGANGVSFGTPWHTVALTAESPIRHS